MGWYSVERSHELAIGEVKPVKAFDRELVLYRTRSGAIDIPSSSFTAWRAAGTGRPAPVRAAVPRTLAPSGSNRRSLKRRQLPTPQSICR